MGTITCAEIETNARALLRDADPDGDFEHSSDELLNWIKEAHSAAVLLKPNVNTVNEAVQLAEGTRQELPAGGVSLVRAINNMGADGSTPGPTITIVSRDTLDNADPNWHFTTPSSTVEHYVFDEDDPTHFDVYPPQPATPNYIRLVFAKNPVLPSSMADPITVDDIYAPVLTDYVCYRALSEDGDNPENRNRAEGFYTKFAEALGVKRNIEYVISPNTGVTQ